MRKRVLVSFLLVLCFGTIPESSARELEVLPGETLAKLSNRVYGSHRLWKRIYAANSDRLSSPDQIAVGMRLRIPNINEMRLNRRLLKYVLKVTHVLEVREEIQRVLSGESGPPTLGDSREKPMPEEVPKPERRSDERSNKRPIEDLRPQKLNHSTLALGIPVLAVGKRDVLTRQTGSPKAGMEVVLLASEIARELRELSLPEESKIDREEGLKPFSRMEFPR